MVVSSTSVVLEVVAHRRLLASTNVVVLEERGNACTQDTDGRQERGLNAVSEATAAKAATVRGRFGRHLMAVVIIDRVWLNEFIYT